MKQKEAQNLINESKRYFVTGNTRTASYHPTLEEFQGRFCDYIRGTLLGVDVDAKLSDNALLDSNVDREKLSDGLAKVTPPDGWWDYKGIECDLTGRGPMWQEGKKLGDIVIPAPIKQCPNGIGGAYEFTMMMKKPMTMAEFREIADAYRARQLCYKIEERDTCKFSESDTSDEMMDELARLFWRRLSPEMEPSIYGADMEGTLFDGATASGWNVDELESCLHLLKADYGEVQESIKGFFRLPGVTTSYLYVGMWGSVFAAHTEDMNLLSINYLHAGAPKYWYSIAPEDAQRFESLACSLFPGHARSCSEFLRHKSQLISPLLLKKAGIKYKTQVQRAGDVIITFPGSYHFGFNTGFNVAESTNFAVPEWIPWGKKARVCMCTPHSVRFDVNRLERLLEDYTNELLTSKEKVAYHEWASTRQMQWNLPQQHRRDKDSPTSVEKTMENEELSSSYTVATRNPVVPMTSQHLSQMISYKNGFFVQVKGDRRSGNERNGGNAKKKKSSEKQNEDQYMEWRRAIRAPGSTLVIGKSVLVILTCYEDSGQRVDRCFSGKIVDIQDSFVRVHYDGMTKDMDSWIDKSSDTIFADGGEATEEEMGIKVHGSSNTPSEEISKDLKPVKKISPTKCATMLKLKAIYKNKPISVSLKVHASPVTKMKRSTEQPPKVRRKVNIVEANPYAKVYKKYSSSSINSYSAESTSVQKLPEKEVSSNQEIPDWVSSLSIIDINRIPNYIRPIWRESLSKKGRGEVDSVYKGVHKRVRKGIIRYSAQINHLGHTHYLGTFDNEWIAGTIFAWAYYVLKNDGTENPQLAPFHNYEACMHEKVNRLNQNAQNRGLGSQPIFHESEFLDGQGTFSSEYAYADIPHFHSCDYPDNSIHYQPSAHPSIPNMQVHSYNHHRYYQNPYAYYYRSSYYRHNINHYC